MTTRSTDLAATEGVLSPRSELRLSLVIPVYRNEDSIPDLLDRLEAINDSFDRSLEVLFVVDGSPDNSHAVLAQVLPSHSFDSRLIAHSRNFGSFAAIRTGMERASGDHVAVMAADLQEPPELVIEFHRVLSDENVDLVVGSRRSRADDAKSQRASRVFWKLYRRFVQREVPEGGVDVFACTARFRDEIVSLEESNSSLVGLAFWLGFQRAEVPYDRLPREHGSSAWTLRKKVRYLSDSVYSFTDLPIRLLMTTGVIGLLLSLLIGLVAVTARLTGLIVVPGYAATIVVIAFFGALNMCGFGIVGAYVWRAYENTKRRPGAIVMRDIHLSGAGASRSEP